jgi:hypothetical protein
MNRRRKGKIERLPAPILAELDRRILMNRYTIDDLKDWLAETGEPFARTTVHRYTRRIVNNLAPMLDISARPPVDSLSTATLTEEFGANIFNIRKMERRNSDIAHEVDARVSPKPPAGTDGAANTELTGRGPESRTLKPHYNRAPVERRVRHWEM